MTKNDFQKIGEIVDRRLASTEQRLEKRLGQRISATEQKLEKRITATEQRLKEEIASASQSVMRDIGQFMEDQLFPMIEEKADKSDVDRLERKLDNFAVKVTEHDKRLDDVEAYFN